MNLSVLIVDDEPKVNHLIAGRIRKEAPHFSVAVVESGLQCLEHLKSNQVDCILSDYQMPLMDGMTLLKTLRSMGNNTPFIFITAQGSEDVAREAFKNGAYDYFTKESGFAHFARITNSIKQAVKKNRSDQSMLESEAALQESEERFRTLFESANDGIFLTDAGVFVDCNSKAVEMYGFEEKADVLGHNPVEFSPPLQPDGSDSGKKAYGLIFKALSGVPQKFYWKSLRGDGTLLDVDISLNAVNLKGKTYIQAIVRDITERKALERQREDLLEILRHDMKTPLAIILGNAELALDKGGGAVDEAMVKMLESIHANVEKLNKMLDDQLIIYNIESGGVNTVKEKADVAELLRQASIGIPELARSKGLSFETEITGSLPLVTIDRTHVISATTNLLHNAVNYTPAGGSIRLTAGPSMRGAEECVFVSVSDDGAGIPADEQGKVFDKYYRSQNAKGVRGSGLGLAIVKAVADEHGGKVELESEAGKGSTFRLVLPVSPRPA